MPHILLSSPLRELADGASTVEIEVGSALESLRALEARYPRLRGWVLDDRGLVREHVKLFVNGREASLETPVLSSDELRIVPAISGG